MALFLSCGMSDEIRLFNGQSLDGWEGLRPQAVKEGFNGENSYLPGVHVYTGLAFLVLSMRVKPRLHPG